MEIEGEEKRKRDQREENRKRIRKDREYVDRE